MEKGYNRVFLNSHAAKLIEEDLEQLTVFSEPEDEDSDAVVERPQLTSRALKEVLQMVNDLNVLYFEVNYFMDKCLNSKHKVEAGMLVNKEVWRTSKTGQSNQRSPVSSLGLLSLISHALYIV